MRVFLDTNVLVSAFATRGLSADVVRLVLADHELLAAEVVLEELGRVLREKLGAPEPAVRGALSVLRGRTVVPTSEASPPVDVEDPDDAVVLASALAAGAEVLVTGDRDLLELEGEVEGLEILTPREFWDRARGA